MATKEISSEHRSDASTLEERDHVTDHAAALTSSKDVSVVEQARFSLRSKSIHDHSNDVIVHWDGPDDANDPFNWPLRKKYFAIGLGLLVSFASSMNGTIITVAHQAINDEFHISDAYFPKSYWPTASWGVGGALMPLILFPVMEDHGVRPVVLGTYLLFICFLIPIGFAQNFATLIVARFFSGGCVQLLCNAAAGVISNVHAEDRARSVPTSLYATVYLAGTSLGPAIGAAILERMSWRWIGYIELIWTAALFPFFFILFPESRGSAILQAKAKRLRQEGINACTEAQLVEVPWYQSIGTSVRRPLYMLLTEPVVFVATMWAAFILGTIYLFTQSVEQVYGELYGWNSLQAGYVQVAIVVGQLLGCAFCAATNHLYYASALRNTEIPGTPIPEARLYASIVGGFLGVTGGMFVYGWTAYPNIPWIAPTVGLAMVGFGTTSVVVSIANYLIDAYQKYAASALGAVGVVENSAIAFLPLAATDLYTNLGFHWASSLLALISLGLVITPFAVLKWGKQIRSRSPFMKEAMIEKKKEATTAGSV